MIYKNDWNDLINQIINEFVIGDKNVESIAKSFLNINYQFMRYGNYDIIMKYTLPGNKQTTEFTYKYKNVNKFR